jgi:hypothetical protein
VKLAKIKTKQEKRWDHHNEKIKKRKNKEEKRRRVTFVF